MKNINPFVDGSCGITSLFPEHSPMNKGDDFITKLLRQKEQIVAPGLVQEIEKAMFKIISLGQYTPRKSPVVREERNQLSKDIYSYLIYGKREIGDALLKNLALKIRDKKQAWDLLTVPPNGRTRQDTKKVEAQEGAKILAKELGIPFSACLEREETTIRCTRDLKGKSVLLYDDMVRTGATLRKTIKALLEKGAENIQPCVLATGMTLEYPEVSVKKGPVQNFIEKLVKKIWKMEIRDINPDSSKKIIQRADKAGILQATDAIREELRKESLIKALPEGEEEGGRKDFDVKEGDTGVYVVQEHEMGLTEESAKSKTPRENLRDTGNVHNDIRMRIKGKDYLVGFTATIGNLKMRNKLLTIKEGEKVLVPAFKLKQPLIWLDIGKTTYHIFEPGEVGAREKSWARMKRVDYGKFEIGTVDEHYIEIRFDGSKLGGRYILQYVPVEDGRKWMISKPQEQTMDREREKGGKDKMDWNELLGPFFEDEGERKEFIETVEKKLSGQDLEKLKGALKILAGIKELPEEAKKAIAVLAKLAGYGSPKEYPVKKIEEIENSNKEMKSAISELGKKIEALEKKAPEKKVDVFGQTVTEGKKKE